MQFLTNLKKRVVSLLGAADAPRHTLYDADLQRRLHALTTSLQRNSRKNREANTMLAELMKPLSDLRWDGLTAQGRQALLTLAELLLVAAQAVSPGERFNYHKALNLLARRLEFGGQYLVYMEPAPGLAVVPDEVAACVQYRAFLYHLLHVAACSLDAESNLSHSSSTPLLPSSSSVAALDPSGVGGGGVGGGGGGGEPAAVSMEPKLDLIQPLARALSSTGVSFVVQSFAAQVVCTAAIRVPEVMRALLSQALFLTEADVQECLKDLRYAEQLVEQQASLQERVAGPQQRGSSVGSLPNDVAGRRVSLDDERAKALKLVGGHGDTGIGKNDLVRMNLHTRLESAVERSSQDRETSTLKTLDETSWFFIHVLDDGSKELAPSEDLLRALPELFNWSAFHSRLDSFDKRSKLPDLGWLSLELFGRNTIMFHLFIKFWVEHVQSVVDTVTPRISLRRVPPFRALVCNLMVSFVESQDRTRQLTDAVTAVLGAEPELISFFLKALFLSTDGTDFIGILNSLMQVESWFKHLSSLNGGTGCLPETFDYDFLCQGFDQILALDHHVTNSRLLTLVYSHSSIFTGDGRAKLFSGLLMGKYGPSLFLSWDANTRSMFSQLLVFRLLRNTRQALQSQPPSLSADKMRVFEQDRLLLSRQEELVRCVRRQVEENKRVAAGGSAQPSSPRVGQDTAARRDFDPHFDVYAERALEEFAVWTDKYNENPEDAANHRLSIIQKKME